MLGTHDKRSNGTMTTVRQARLSDELCETRSSLRGRYTVFAGSQRNRRHYVHFPAPERPLLDVHSERASLTVVLIGIMLYCQPCPEVRC